MDKRQTGVHEVRLPDGTSYQASVTKVRAWVGLVSAIVSLGVLVGGLVLGGVKFGLTTQVRGVIEEECEPKGIIHDRIRCDSDEFIEEMQVVLQDDLDDFDERMEVVEHTVVGLKGGQVALAAQQTRNQDELRMLIQRAINDGDHQ